MAYVVRGHCPECERSQRLTARETLARHYIKGGGRVCPGSGGYPVIEPRKTVTIEPGELL